MDDQFIISVLDRYMLKLKQGWQFKFWYFHEYQIGTQYVCMAEMRCDIKRFRPIFGCGGDYITVLNLVLTDIEETSTYELLNQRLSK